jgi:23S rRNA pseudouridine2457 synthase
MITYFIIYKPFGVLSQFTKETEDQKTLADLEFEFPKDVYPVGRLDADSEGLLILSNDKKLNEALLHPKNKHNRCYLAQVEGIPTEESLKQLRNGVPFKVKGKMYQSQAAIVTQLQSTPSLPERNPPIRFRMNKPTSWIQLELSEGKNRQVRKMCAAVGFPVLRLVRTRIESLELGDMLPGEVRSIERTELFSLLQLK